MEYFTGVELIQKYTPGSSITPIMEFIMDIEIKESHFIDALEQVGAANRYPDSFVGILKFIRFILGKRRELTHLYETGMQRYEEIQKATGHRKPNEDEAKIKKTLMDFILKAEKSYEINDLTDEAIIKELSRFISEANLYGMTETELQNLRISSKTVTLLETHLDKYREIYFSYQKLITIFQRLVRISDYILEEAVA